MSVRLIINARDRLAWHRRLLSDLSTAVMWVGWLWLWSPVLRAWIAWATGGTRLFPAVTKLFASASVDAMERSLVAVAGTSGALFVWKRLAARRARAASALSLRDYAHHFELPEHEIHASRHASICVVQHDDRGRIVRLNRREPLGQPQAMAG